MEYYFCQAIQLRNDFHFYYLNYLSLSIYTYICIYVDLLFIVLSIFYSNICWSLTQENEEIIFVNYSGKLQEKNDFVSFLFVCRLLDMYFVDYHKTQCLHIRCYETRDEVSSRIFTSGDIPASHQLCVLEKSSLVGRGDPQWAGGEGGIPDGAAECRGPACLDEDLLQD